MESKGLGQRLSLLAKLKGLTQDQIAKRCAMSRISVNRFFKEHTELRASDFKTLLATLGIDLDQIIDREIERQMFGEREKLQERVLAAVK
jgi:transcriptional regulator with XRE-family HTH domain